ncbi:hypothetical protein [Sphingobacterium siyangense]|uniref:hypothetical protein n=1 Tax=Sphingobacterium siyangense TaxID=459529 RepID=UPI002FD937CD
MDTVIYEPKELLVALIELEKRLATALGKYCPNNDLLLSEDLDKALEDFLQLREVADNEIGYLSSQLALIHLEREIERTIEVVIDSNNLRAYYDYNEYLVGKDVKKLAQKRQWQTKDVFLAALLGGLLTLLLSWFFVLD